MTDTKEAIELVEKAERRIFVPLECKDLLDQALALLRQAQEPECKHGVIKSVPCIKCGEEYTAKSLREEPIKSQAQEPKCKTCGDIGQVDDLMAGNSNMLTLMACPKCHPHQEQPRHYTCSKCGKTFPKYMGKEFRDHVTYCEPKEQPPAGEFTTKSKYFNKSSITAFAEREKRLRAMKEWPETGWYNDEEFCEIYKEACDIIDAETQRANRAETLTEPHLESANCPTYHDGCHCTVETLIHNIERADKAEVENNKLLDTLMAAGFIGKGTQIVGNKRYEELVEAEAKVTLQHSLTYCKEHRTLYLKNNSCPWCLQDQIKKLEAKLKDLLAACKELIENEPHGITPYFDEALRKIEDILNKEISGEKRGK